MSRRHKPPEQDWWVTYENEKGEEAQVSFRWVEVTRGLWDVIPTAVRFDLFTPQPEQDALHQILQRIRVSVLDA